MPRTARPIERMSEDVLEAASEEFRRCALKALEGRVANQRELADRLGWPETTLSAALKGRFTFSSWPKICAALGLDPVDELVRGRDELRAEQDREREAAYRDMLERAEADTLISFWRTLSPEARARVRDRMSADKAVAGGAARRRA